MQSLDQRLCEAVWAGDLDLVKELVSAGANVDCYDEAMGDTPLHLAAEQGFTDIARVLLEAGADIEKTPRSGYWTPLVHAVDTCCDATVQLDRPRSDVSLVVLLLESGAAAGGPDERAVSIARKYGNQEVEKLLLDYQ
jgi:ankyrin repeat protein